MRTREDELREIPHRPPKPEEWPPGIRGISIEEVGAIGVDARGDLYWQGKQVEIRRPLALSFWQKLGAVLVAASTVSMAVLDVLRYFSGH